MIKKHINFNDKNQKCISQWFILIALISTINISNVLHLTMGWVGGGEGRVLIKVMRIRVYLSEAIKIISQSNVNELYYISQ